MPFLFVGNWKMYFTHRQACAWAATHLKELSHILQGKDISFVVCPSFDALTHVAQHAQQYGIPFGAQDCSGHKPGAFTGQVAAASLAELGCTYCIVGHSETRNYLHVNDNDVAGKVKQLLDNNIIPIVCIGETKQEYQQNKTMDILYQQLEPLVPTLKNNKKALFIAYEPIWSIGTGDVPTSDQLQLVFNGLADFCSSFGINSVRFIYGGSVDEDSAADIIKISHIQGVLVGRASTDFQKIKSVVSLIENP